MNVKTFLPIITVTLFAFRAAAQTSAVDTVARTDSSRVIDFYHKTIGGQSAFFNGEEYYPPAQAVKGSPFFQGSMATQLSQVRYNGFWYKDVPVFYDQYNDQMVSVDRSSLYAVRPGYLSDVILAGHHFIYLGAQQSGNLDAGYYDQLYDGKSTVLVKRLSNSISHAGERNVEVYYDNRDVIYIKKGNQYVQVNGKGSVLDVFKDKSKQLKQFLSANKIDYNKDKESSIVKLAAYYDQPTN